MHKPSVFPINMKSDETYTLVAKHESQQKKKLYGTSSYDNQLSISLPTEASGPYPIAVILVLLSKTFEAFAANGVRSILALYLRDSLRFDESYSTAILHTFNFFSQFLPIVGAILADSYLGNTKTIFLFSIPYVFGYIGAFLGTLPFAFVTHALIYASLLLIATGNGCLRACITALGGHQFRLPQQEHFLEQYFAIYYCFYYAGILLGKIVPAFARDRVEIDRYCSVDYQCYPAAFGLIALAFLISWAIFLLGMKIYKREYVTGDNTMLKVCGCIYYATYKKIFVKSKHTQTSWLQGAVGRYSSEFVNEVSTFLKVIALFITIPIYYSLLVQQDSTWTFQASQTDTTIFGIKIAADQFKAIGPILLLIQIPLWERFVVPCTERFGVHISPLECVSIGGLLAGFSFVCSGFLQFRIQAYPHNPPSILWQFPMFFLVMMGEVLISVNGLKFCYTKAPTSMKSVLTAVWFVNNAMGNLIVVIFTQLRLFEDKTLEFFFYAFLMFVATILFTLSAVKYERNNQDVPIQQTGSIRSTNLE